MEYPQPPEGSAITVTVDQDAIELRWMTSGLGNSTLARIGSKLFVVPFFLIGAYVLTLTVVPIFLHSKPLTPDAGIGLLLGLVFMLISIAVLTSKTAYSSLIGDENQEWLRITRDRFQYYELYTRPDRNATRDLMDWFSGKDGRRDAITVTPLEIQAITLQPLLYEQALIMTTTTRQIEIGGSLPIADKTWLCGFLQEWAKC